MAEYLPIFKPGQAITLKASAAVTGGQVVEITGVGTVGPAGANSTKVVGVAGFDAAINDYVTVYAGGVQNCTSAGVITAGDLIAAAAAGTVATNAAPAAGVQIGIALSTTTGAGQAVRIQFAR
ncbi:MAG TPA: DUF2190 family protein [Thermoanaerobaculales bacterium]|nr:DUF2190 family protein [Thermoanaerobaculales bacterium]